MGHRTVLGLTFHPVTGALWETENGPARRRRSEHHPARQELWLARSHLRPRLRRQAPIHSRKADRNSNCRNCSGSRA